MKTISFCKNPNGGCCPQLYKEDDLIIIIDDYGGRVKFDKLEWDVLKQKIEDGEID